MGKSVQGHRSKTDQPAHGQSSHGSLWVGLGGDGKARLGGKEWPSQERP